RPETKAWVGILGPGRRTATPAEPIPHPVRDERLHGLGPGEAGERRPDAPMVPLQPPRVAVRIERGRRGALEESRRAYDLEQLEHRVGAQKAEEIVDRAQLQVVE